MEIWSYLMLMFAGKCSIWNFELAISNSSESYPVNYYQYYCLSPELLLQLDSEVDLHCCVLSDVYAIGLLMWQMSKRCSLYGMHVCMHVCMYVCMYGCVCVCIVCMCNVCMYVLSTFCQSWLISAHP